MNENENTTTQSLWDTVGAVLMGRFIAIYLDKDTEGRSVSRLEMTGIQLAEIQSGRGESRAR